MTANDFRRIFREQPSSILMLFGRGNPDRLYDFSSLKRDGQTDNGQRGKWGWGCDGGVLPSRSRELAFYGEHADPRGPDANTISHLGPRGIEMGGKCLVGVPSGRGRAIGRINTCWTRRIPFRSSPLPSSPPRFRRHRPRRATARVRRRRSRRVNRMNCFIPFSAVDFLVQIHSDANRSSVASATGDWPAAAGRRLYEL